MVNFYWFDFESSSGIQEPIRKDPTKFQWKVDPKIDVPITFQYMELDSVVSKPVIRRFYQEDEKEILEFIADQLFSGNNYWNVPVNENLWYDLTLYFTRCKKFDVHPQFNLLDAPNSKPFIDLKPVMVLLNKKGDMSGFKDYTKNAGKPKKRDLPQDLNARKDFVSIEIEVQKEAEWFRELWLRLRSRKFSFENIF